MVTGSGSEPLHQPVLLLLPQHEPAEILRRDLLSSCRKQRPGAQQPVGGLSGEAAAGPARPDRRLPPGLRLLREHREPGER